MAEIKDLKRMCKAHENCGECPLLCECSAYGFSDKLDEIIDKWVKEHPVKTYAMDFFEKFPNAPKGRYGTPVPCIEDIYGVDKKLTGCPKGNVDCLKCWNQEV